MANVKLCLTPYRFAEGDAVQTFFQENEANTGFEYTEGALELFRPTWQPGLDFWSSHLTQGQAQGWWRHIQAPDDAFGYEAVRTLGLYESNKEPSICIDLDLVKLEQAVVLLRSAAEFGRTFNQSSVHVLFSLRQNLARNTWHTDAQLKKLSIKSKVNEVHLATFGDEISGRTTLNAALSVGMSGLTTDITRHQTFFYHPQGLDHTIKWNVLTKILRSHVALEYEETWDALLFAIGNGGECTSTYEDWLG